MSGIEAKGLDNGALSMAGVMVMLTILCSAS